MGAKNATSATGAARGGDMSHREHATSMETATQAAPEPAPRGDALVVVVTPPDGAQRGHPLSEELFVGRDPGCAISVDDPALSRRHARLRRHEGAVEVEDLGSRNGVFVNGRRAKRLLARPHSVVRAGDTLLSIVPLTEEWQAPDSSGPLVGGASLVMARRMISLLGPSDLPVLILGETGTGKDVAARLLHDHSRRDGPFIAVNCAALPHALVESEIFGHVRGAFTGADRARQGLFAAASGGTLFLDEIGELPLPAQATLLRVLEDGAVRPVGAERTQVVDVRVLSATNRDLHQAVDERTFRADLLARLGAVEVRLPPLRERTEDLPLLAAHLLARAGKEGVHLHPDGLEAMTLHDWPYNIRELDNVLRAAALEGAVVLRHLPERIQLALHRARGGATAVSPLALTTDPRARIEALLAASGGNVRRTSQELGIARSHVYRLMERYGIDPGRFRAGRGRGTELAPGNGEG
jgi:DNA-binding NtrC family response regulator